MTNPSYQFIQPLRHLLSLLSNQFKAKLRQIYSNWSDNILWISWHQIVAVCHIPISLCLSLPKYISQIFFNICPTTKHTTSNWTLWVRSASFTILIFFTIPSRKLGTCKLTINYSPSWQDKIFSALTIDLFWLWKLDGWVVLHLPNHRATRLKKS